MKLKNPFLILSTLITSACFCPQLLILNIPVLTFEPGFEVPGQYEIFADGELLTAGELGPDADLHWDIDGPDIMGPQALITVTDDIPRLVGVIGESHWRDIEVLRDGEVVGRANAEWHCTELKEQVFECGTSGGECSAMVPFGDI